MPEEEAARKMGGKPPFQPCGGEDKRQDKWAFLYVCVYSTEYLTASMDKQAVTYRPSLYQLKQLEEQITLQVWVPLAAAV